MAISVPAAVLQEIINSVDKGILNRRAPIKIDRKAMPLKDFWFSRIKKVESNQGAVRVALQKSAENPMQGWTNLDPLAFNENEIDLQTEFNFYNLHLGLIFVHDYMMNEGYDIDYNEKNPKIANPLSQNEAGRLRNIVKDKLEAHYDNFDVQEDLILHRDGSVDPKLPPGLDAFVPLALTGSLGGVPFTNPLVAPYIALGLTYTLGGTMREGMNTAMWNARLNSRGRSNGKYRIICGRGFADRYSRYATANAWQVHTMAEGTKKLDISISDSGLQFQGIPLEIDPTFDILDTLDAPATPWTLRCYFLYEEAFVYGHPGAQDKKMSMPPDPADVRMTRVSLDKRVSPLVTIGNANAVVTAAS